MNYLAHAFLSGQDDNLLTGNFIADHIRGNHYEMYPEAIIRGIKLHREIDSFTDAHDLFKQSKRVFYNGFEKHSGILVDIYFDHLLARNFQRWSDTPLNVFSANVYKVYDKNRHLLPVSSSRFLDYVITNNVYSGYANSNDIKRVLSHLSSRIRHRVQLDASFDLFRVNEATLDVNFTAFFEDALAHFKA